MTSSINISTLDGNNGFQIDGVEIDSNLGIVAGSAGDINNDGINDLILSANGADPNGLTNAGETYIIFGNSAGFPVNFDLNSLNGSNGFTIRGIDAEDRSGLPISTAGDINNDGIDDIIISAIQADPNGLTNAGEVYIIFGNNTGFPANFELSDLNGSNGFIINGIADGGLLGFSISDAGDINNDGIDDIILGAAFADVNGVENAGVAYIIFGGDNFGASFDLSQLDGRNGFTLNNSRLGNNARLGNAANNLGDVNGDGIDDILITAPFADANGFTNTGISYVVFGSPDFNASLDLSQLNGTNGFIINGIDIDDTAGRSAAGAGDINADGLNDIIIGAAFADGNGNENAGETYIIFGNNTGFAANFDLTQLNGDNGFVVNGIDAEDLAGLSISGAGDVNDDNIDDILIGAPDADPDGVNITGEGYVIYGSNSGFAASFDLTQLNGDNGFVITGANNGDRLGGAVNRIGDINGDTVNDIFIGASSADPNGVTDAGTAYFLFGSNNGFAPDAVDDAAIIPFNSATAINVLANDSDPDNDPFFITSVIPSTGATVTVNDNGTASDQGDDVIIYTPSLDFTGVDTFTYTIEDSSGKTDTAIVTLTVNTPPTAVEDTDTTSPLTPVSINVLANDSDPDNSPEPITLVEVSLPENGTATLNNNATPADPSDDVIIYTPNPGFAGTDIVSYTISDGVDSAIANVTIEVIPGVPTPLDDAATTVLNTPVTIDVLSNDTDPENDPLIITAVSQPENGTATLDNASIIYTPNPGFTGVETFTYTVDDSNGGIDTANVTVSVIVIPNISLTAEGTLTEAEETPATFTLNLSDPAPEPLAINLNLTGTTATNLEDFILIPGSNITEFTSNSLLLDTGVSTATLTIQPIDDAIFDPNETVEINLLSGEGYTLDETASIASLTITDNDEANIEITPTSGLITTENGQTASFNIVLTSQPTADVSFELINNDPSEATLSNSSITFTPENWDISQTVILTGEADVIVDGDIVYTISTTPAVSNDSNYNDINPDDITVTNLDLTQPTVIVNPTAGLITTEAGGTTTFNVVLGSQPTADVVLPFTSDNNSEGTIFPDSLTFTSTNWFTPQTIRITGVNDPVDDGDISYQILTQNTISEDSNYNGINPDDVTVINEDNDTANIRVTPTTGLITTERGETANFEVFLTSQPVEDVIINLRSDNPNEGILAIDTVTFTPLNWNNPQTITVTGVNDNIVDENVSYNIITDPAISNDSNYNGLDAEDINLTNIDLSEPFIVINPTVGLMTRETGRSDSFNVVLNTQPSDIVTLNLSSNDSTEGVISPEGINFTPDNWDIPQTVTVTGVDDNLVDGNISYTIVTDAAISNDINYDNLNPADILVTNQDDDLPVVNLSVTPTLTTEADTTTVTITATTSAEVNGDQTISLNVTGDEITGSDFTLSNSQITIANDTTTGSATLTILDDNFIEDNETVIIELFNPSTGIQLGENNTATLTIIDNDSLPTVSFSQADYFITEDGFNIGENIVLNRSGNLSQPSIVEVQLVDDTAISNIDFDSNPIQVNFTANQETAIVNPIIFDDNEVESEESLQLLLNPIENAEIDPQNTANLTILDNEQAEIIINQTDLLTTEAGLTDTYTIVLTREPIAPVNITFETSDRLQPISEIIFDSSNWNSPQSINVSAIDDQIINEENNTIIRHIVNSNDESYNNFNIPDVSVEIGDDEIADIILSSDNFSISENNETQQYSLVLSSIPTAPVTITFDTGNQINPISDITFNSNNWNQPQIVSFSAINDEINQGDRNATINHIINSEDENYNGLLIDAVEINIIDDDISIPEANITVNPINLNVTESGIQGSYQVSLTTEPFAPVTLEFITDNQINSIPNIIFDSNNFNQPQIVTLTAIDDEIVEGIHNSTIFTNINSNDSRFNDLTLSSLTVTIEDNDTVIPVNASVYITQTEGNTTVAETELIDTYNIVLTSQPTADVILNITPDNQTDLGNGSNNTIQLLFTSQNWNLPQIVTVTATDDTVVEGNHTSIINHNLSSLDPDYNAETPILIDGIASSNLIVEIIDNDNFGNLNLIQPLGENDVIEGFGEDRYKIALTAPPVADVVINIVENSQIITNQSTLTFTPENWNISQSISLEAIDDTLTEGQQQTTLIHQISSTDNRFNNLSFPLTVNISDNDNIGENYTDNNQSVHSGTLQDDIITGSNNNNIFYGNQGNDLLSGLTGEDILLGQTGDDAILAGSENDVISGGKGNDYLVGNTGNDTIFGDDGRDRLFGGQGNDQLVGGGENDRLWGDLGTDSLTGGEGEDAFVLSIGTGGFTPNLADVITDFNPNLDRIELTDSLTFSQLTLSQTTEGTLIQLQSTGEYLAILLEVNLEVLQPTNFI
ncbi:MAG: Ig-like domain-containing protein [Microcoleaceae cyanobacterium]